jgi:orotate phosphoribosyltransferase-like protein
MEIISLEKFNSLLKILIKKIQSDENFHPDAVIALSTGGFPVAAAIAKQIGIKSCDVVGIPIYKDETGDYYLDDKLVSLRDCKGRQVLIIDDASRRGLLTKKAVKAVEENGGKAKSCVLIAWKDGIQPDYVAETSEDDPPVFYWEK